MEKLARATQKIILQRPQSALIALGILAYWPIGLFQHRLKWDMIDTQWPWRYLMGESLRAGEFPLWNPFQQLGYPIHADVRSVWNPEALLTSWVFGPGPLALHLILLAYLLLAGLGMYQLLLRWKLPLLDALTGGVVYMLCGYMVGQAQDMPRIAAAALLPWSVAAWLGMREQAGKWKAALLFGFWMYAQLSAGYQAIAIIINYLFLLLFALEIGKLLSHKKSVWPLFKSHVIGYGTLVLLSLPMLYSLWESAPFVARFGEGVTEEQALNHPFSPASFLSFFSPWAVTVDHPIFQTDVSMRNAFLGIVGLLLMTVGILRWKTLDRSLRGLMGFGILAILPALGHFTPVRMWLYHHIPLFNLFKTPAYFILFFLFAAIVVAANSLRLVEGIRLKKLPGLLLVFSVLCGWMAYRSGSVDPGSSEVWRRMAWQLGVSTILLLPLAWKGSLCIWRWVWIAEMVVALQFNLPETAVEVRSPSSYSQYYEHLPHGFALQPQQILEEQSEINMSFPGIFRNNGVFQKRISPAGFNSFYFDQLNALERDSSRYQRLLRLPPAFWETRQGDTLIEGNGFPPMEWIALQAHEIQLKTLADQSGRLHLLQSKYPGWQVTIDTEPQALAETTGMFLAVDVPAGEHYITFSYRHPTILKLLAFSGSLWLLLSGGLLWTIFGRTWALSIIASVLLLLLAGVQWHGWQKKRHAAQIKMIEQERGAAFLLGIGEDMSRDWGPGWNPFGAPWNGSLNNWKSYLEELPRDTILFVQASARHAALWEMVDNHYPHRLKESSNNSQIAWKLLYRDEKLQEEWHALRSSAEAFLTAGNLELPEGSHTLLLRWRSATPIPSSCRWVAELPEADLWYGVAPASGFMELQLQAHPTGNLKLYLWNPEMESLPAVEYQYAIYP